ncbi:MAG: DUF1549 and DUF1553 domain-containing protein [Gemmataceae bacterium]
MPFRLLTLAVFLVFAPAATAEPARFDVEVMAVLSKAGCNQGACHGNLNGKGGFKLSLRGEDADWDFGVLTRDNLGRRTDPLHPTDSLILKKAAGTVPHEGGRRFEVGSNEYRILRDWIAGGTKRVAAPRLVSLEVEPAERILIEPAESLNVSAQAVFSDGSRMDVTRLAAYELSNPLVAEVAPNGTVRKMQSGETAVAVRFLGKQATVRLAFAPARPGFRWANSPEANFIDRHVFAKLKALRVNPSSLAPDDVFLRRAFLDAIGKLPTIVETKAFLGDPRPDKRARLVDELLKRPEFADYWALKWSDVLRNEEKVLDRKGVEVFHGWIRKCIADGMPLNEFARELIAARGSTYAEPAANYYRALRDPPTRAEATAQVFLGIRLQCCRCHNHPFDRWTQNDYYQLTAFFSRVQYRIVENNRRDKFDKHEFDGEQIVWMERGGDVMHPRTGAAVSPKFLADDVKLADDADRLVELADWIARPDNPFFARTQANRIWSHLMGRGLVDPIDDFRASNPPSHPALLDELAREFARSHFDLRALVRTIMASRTYQLGPEPTDSNRDEDGNYARAMVRRLDAEVLLDAVAQVLEMPVKFEGKPPGVRAVQLPGVQQKGRGRSGDAERFMKAFGKPDRLLSCECERFDDVTVPQTLQMLAGEMLVKMIETPDNRLGRLLKEGRSDDEILDEFFLAALCRPPTAEQRLAMKAYIGKNKSRRSALEDIVWALLNARDFLVRR